MLVKDNRKCTWYGEEITEDKYSEILSMLRNSPEAPAGFGYRLTAELEWELYEIPVEEDSALLGLEQSNSAEGCQKDDQMTCDGAVWPSDGNSNTWETADCGWIKE